MEAENEVVQALRARWPTALVSVVHDNMTMRTVFHIALPSVFEPGTRYRLQSTYADEVISQHRDLVIADMTKQIEARLGEREAAAVPATGVPDPFAAMWGTMRQGVYRAGANDWYDTDESARQRREQEQQLQRVMEEQVAAQAKEEEEQAIASVLDALVKREKKKRSYQK